MRNPTLRKCRNRGLTPIRYQLPEAGGYRHGWLTGEETRTKVQVHLVGDEGNRWLSKGELQFITNLERDHG